MLTTTLRYEIEREQRSAGLPPGAATVGEIRRRRHQVALTGVVAGLGLVVVTFLVPLWGDDGSAAVVHPDLLRAAMIVVTLGFVAYAVDKERHLRRLDRLGEAQHEVHVAVADRLLRTSRRASMAREEMVLYGDVLTLLDEEVD